MFLIVSLSPPLAFELTYLLQLAYRLDALLRISMASSQFPCVIKAQASVIYILICTNSALGISGVSFYILWSESEICQMACSIQSKVRQASPKWQWESTNLNQDLLQLRTSSLLRANSCILMLMSSQPVLLMDACLRSFSFVIRSRVIYSILLGRVHWQTFFF